MDQFVLDLGPDARERAGDRVELFGTGADGGSTAEDWARAADTISYEIVTRVGARVPRVHVDSEVHEPRVVDEGPRAEPVGDPTAVR